MITDPKHGIRFSNHFEITGAIFIDFSDMFFDKNTRPNRFKEKVAK
jgi:hypothetical protein